MGRPKKKSKEVSVRKKEPAILKHENKIVVSDKIEQVLITGDLKALTPAERLDYYRAVCKSLNLNPLTQPFDYIVLNGKLTLYAKKGCAEQIRKNMGISVYDQRVSFEDDMVTVIVFLQDFTGRKDTGTGVVNLKGLSGDVKANAIMKAETKAKRRGTLSMGGLGMLDETEVETIPLPKDAKSYSMVRDVTPESDKFGQAEVENIPDETPVDRVLKVVNSFNWKGRVKEYQWVKNELSTKDVTTEYADTIIDHIEDLKLPPLGVDVQKEADTIGKETLKGALGDDLF